MLLTAPNTSTPVQSRGDRRARLLDTVSAVETPALLIDPEVVAANYRRIAAAFPTSPIYYAVKANPHPAVLTPLIDAGCGMDVASGSELELVLAMGATPRHIVFSAPFKRARDIAVAHRHGVKLFAADSPGEVDNVARNAPGARILIRVAVAGGVSLSPMGRKFGANYEDVLPLLERARNAGLVPWGLHFHVGSQCLDPRAWTHAIAECATIWHAARAAGMPLRMIDIGGGYPVRYNQNVPAIEEIAELTRAEARDSLDVEAQVALEPGRWMTRGAAVLVTEVIGMATRGTEEWVYLDAGVYNGLIDTTEGVVYPMHTPDELRTTRRRPRRTVTLAGPSCDGNDVMTRDVEAPALTHGDRLLLFQAGAYTTAFERFNGLSFPGVVDLSAQQPFLSVL